MKLFYRKKQMCGKNKSMETKFNWIEKKYFQRMISNSEYLCTYVVEMHFYYENSHDIAIIANVIQLTRHYFKPFNDCFKYSLYIGQKYLL